MRVDRTLPSDAEAWLQQSTHRTRTSVRQIIVPATILWPLLAPLAVQPVSNSAKRLR